MKKLLLVVSLIPICLLGQKILPSSAGGELIHHEYYTLSFSEENEQALWVAYPLTHSMVAGAVNRTDNFRADPKVSSGSATLNDYKGSGYDRGHLAPAADMRINLTAMSESFYLSNMSPQTPSFNRGIWKKLESLTRSWAYDMDTLYMVTGPIFRSNLGSIGSHHVTVPGFFYKVMYSPKKKQMIGFVLPNRKSSEPLSTFVKTVDDVESITGIDFFCTLNDSLEQVLESTVHLTTWDFTNSSSNTYSISKNTSSATACKGIAKSTGQRCKNKTKNVNGYCHLHQEQVGLKTHVGNSQDGRCEATTQSGNQCKRKADDGSKFCWQHKR